jgi:hypothetical protein
MLRGDPGGRRPGRRPTSWTGGAEPATSAVVRAILRFLDR